MFFTKAGFVIAWLLFIPGVIGYGIILASVFGNISEMEEIFGKRFLASSGSFGLSIALGIAFGIASEISTAIVARQTGSGTGKS